MNDKEKNFLNSIKTKIKKYSIPITTKEAIKLASGTFVETSYNNNTTELVDVSIERELCKRSCYYFIANYGYIHFPGIGIIPYDLYYFQREILKDTENFKKLVFLKSRQAGISTLFSLYAFWLGNFRESENIDVVSIKQKKAHAFTKKMFPTMDRTPDFLKTPVVKKNMAEIEWANGSYMLSESASDKAGRGDSLSLLILDELAFYRSDALTRGIVSAAQPTLTRTGGQQVLISCVTEDTYLFTDKGIRQMKDYIPENMEPGFNMIPMFRIDGVEPNQACNLFYDSGITDTIKIKTKLGFELEGTALHPVVNYNFQKTEERFGWTRLGDIKKGDLVTLKEGMNTFGSVKKFAGVNLKRITAFVLGALYIKGKVDFEKNIISVPYNKKQWLRYRMFAAYFKTSLRFSNSTAFFKSKDLVESFKLAGFFEDKIPSELLQMGRELTTAFLKGLCLGNANDGLISNKKEALKQIQLMSLNIGRITRRIGKILTPASEFSFRYQEYFIDEVVSIKQIKNKHTYDFYIPKTNTFVTNGIISHNTPNGLSGTGSYYAEQVQQLQIAGEETPTDKLVTIDWFEIPDIKGIFPQKGYNDVLQKYIEKDYYRNKNSRKEMRKFFKTISDNPMANAFLKKQHDDLGAILYRQEIEHDFIVSGDQVFSEEVLDRIKESVMEPFTKNKIGESRANGLFIWKHPIPKKRYIMGIDVSTGTGNDYSSVQVMDVENYEQVAEYKGQMATKTFGQLIKKIALYYNEAFVVIECNSIGEAVFNEVYYSEEDPYFNVYKQKKTTKDGRSRVTGWETNVKTRQLMLNNLIDYFTVEELSDVLKVYSERMYKEMLSFVWINGRAVHTTNGHDDTLIAFGLCLYFRNKANTVGNSFLINEDGDFLGTENIKDLDDVKLNENGFGITSSDDSGSDDFEDIFGMSRENYNWLID